MFVIRDIRSAARSVCDLLFLSWTTRFLGRSPSWSVSNFAVDRGRLICNRSVLARGYYDNVQVVHKNRVHRTLMLDQ